MKSFHLELNLFFYLEFLSEKDECGTGAFHDHGIVQEATRFIKKNYPKSLLLLIHVFVNIQAMVIVE